MCSISVYPVIFTVRGALLVKNIYMFPWIFHRSAPLYKKQIPHTRINYLPEKKNIYINAQNKRYTSRYPRATAHPHDPPGGPSAAAVRRSLTTRPLLAAWPSDLCAFVCVCAPLRPWQDSSPFVHCLSWGKVACNTDIGVT